MKKLTIRQKNRLKTMCIACGLDTIALRVNNPMLHINPKHWLELCATVLFERIIGYNHQKMGDMMYAFMLGNRNPIDFLYEEYQKKDSDSFNRK